MHSMSIPHVVAHPSGTVALPGMRFTAETGTGWRWVSAGIIALSLTGSERLRINTNSVAAFNYTTKLSDADMELGVSSGTAGNVLGSLTVQGFRTSNTRFAQLTFFHGTNENAKIEARREQADDSVGGLYFLTRDVADAAPVERLSLSGAKVLTFADAVNVAFDATTGTKLGTATTQKVGFYNATPIVQGAVVADAAGGVTIDAEARTAINALLARIRSIGIIAT